MQIGNVNNILNQINIKLQDKSTDLQSPADSFQHASGNDKFYELEKQLAQLATSTTDTGLYSSHTKLTERQSALIQLALTIKNEIDDAINESPYTNKKHDYKYARTFILNNISGNLIDNKGSDEQSIVTTIAQVTLSLLDQLGNNRGYDLMDDVEEYVQKAGCKVMLSIPTITSEQKHIIAKAIRKNSVIVVDRGRRQIYTDALVKLSNLERTNKIAKEYLPITLGTMSVAGGISGILGSVMGGTGMGVCTGIFGAVLGYFTIEIKKASKMDEENCL